MKFFENYYPTATPIEAVSREQFLNEVREIAKEDPTREISILHGRDEAGQDCFAIVSASLGTDIGSGEEAVTAAENFNSWWDAEFDDDVTEYEDRDLDDEVIAIAFSGTMFGVVERSDYIKRFLGLDPYRASEDEIEAAEDAGDGFIACESAREAYNATSFWNFNRRLCLVHMMMESDSRYAAEAEELYSDLKALWVDQIVAGVEGKLNPEANQTAMDYESWCDYYAACACNEVNDFSEVDIPARDAKDGKAFTIWFEAPEELA